MTHRIFIDGQAGTTGLEITARLAGRADLELIELSDAQRKDDQHRADALRAADVSILCLPDDAARSAVALGGEQTRYIDASTAHRTHPDWIYGLPELRPEQRTAIAAARFVSNPGCYPQGFILAVRPLIEGGLLPADARLTCYGLSGYSGGGRQMVERYQAADEHSLGARPYALQLTHKHLPEMQHYAGTKHPPVFTPVVCHYYKGMTVQVPLDLRGYGLERQQVQRALSERYADDEFVRVLALDDDSILDAGALDPQGCNDTNRLELMVFGNAHQVVLTARYDNLGKGASGAAVQNLNLMLGLDETTGLTL